MWLAHLIIECTYNLSALQTLGSVLNFQTLNHYL